MHARAWMRTGRATTAALIGLATLSGCAVDKATGPEPRLIPAMLAATALPPTLTGEILTGAANANLPPCPASGVSVFHFFTNGTAAGPYVGTYFESGQFGVTWGPPDPITGVQVGTVTHFDADFRITAATGTVVGEKFGVTSVTGAIACHQNPNALSIVPFLVINTQYTATISVPGFEPYVDRGETQVKLVFTHPRQFTETFVSTRIPATVVLDPPAATNPVGTEHCVTATVRDAFGNPVQDVAVRFAVQGSVNTSGSATTDSNGQASFCYQGPPLPGADAITAFADTDGDGTQDPDEPSGAATKTWVLPQTTPLCEINITQGGWIIAQNGDRATFGGNAKADGAGVTTGEQEYQDHGPVQPLNVHSINVLAIVCEGTREAAIYGDATIDGTGRFVYRIKVRDLAEPGTGTDTYSILLSNGYTSGEQILHGGNVQVRRGDS
jgi:hypothetical protein